MAGSAAALSAPLPGGAGEAARGPEPRSRVGALPSSGPLQNPSLNFKLLDGKHTPAYNKGADPGHK